MSFPIVNVFPKALFILFILVTISCLFMNQEWPSSEKILFPESHTNVKYPHVVVQDSTVSDRSKFIATAERTPIQHFDPLPIQKKCSSRAWPNDLVFQCDWIVGGPCNVRQEIFACMRWAIESGAGLVLPKIYPRVSSNSTEKVLNEWGKPVAMDGLFDRDGMVANLKQACPQMAIYDDVKDIPGPGKVQDLGKVHAWQLGEKSWQQWISENRADVGQTSLVTFAHTLSEHAVCNDGAEFTDALGKLVPFRKDTHHLAAIVLYELSQQFNLRMDPSTGLAKTSFLGIHLRTSSDAAGQGWMNYSTQASLYNKLARNYTLPVIYIASGNATSISMFSETIAPTPVVTKSSLLHGKDLALLKSMTWDQQGIVDYLVLLKASKFLGMSESSFSWNIAVARRAVGKSGTCGDAKPKQDGPIAYRDELSVVIGKPSKYDFGNRFWP